MPEDKPLPFHSFNFTLIADKRPRTAFRLKAVEGGMYELHVEKGSASNPTSQFTREVPVDVVQRLKDALQEIGVFGWDESYGDAKAPGSRRWTVNTVFKEGVFSISSKGGSDAPAGFDAMLEELYRLDFPRPAERAAVGNSTGSGRTSMPVMPTSMGDLAAFMSQGGLPDLDSAELQQRMKDEVRRMGPAERKQLIDMLLQSGMGTREFWEDFFNNL